MAYCQTADHPLILIANRDEFYGRPTAPAGYWTDFPSIYGGRDLRNGGTWLGVTENKRFAAVTNYRDPSAQSGTRSRGDLVADFLKTETPPLKYLSQIQKINGEYSGFNLIVGQIGEKSELGYYSNRGGDPVELVPGIYGLSNHLLETPWPKVQKGKSGLTDVLTRGSISNSTLFKILADETLAEDGELPATGLPLDAERALSAVYIRTPEYGTRCSTVLKFNNNFEWDFEEKVFV